MVTVNQINPNKPATEDKLMFARMTRLRFRRWSFLLRINLKISDVATFDLVSEMMNRLE